MAAQLKIVLAVSAWGSVTGCMPPLCADGSTPKYTPHDEPPANWAWATEQCEPDAMVKLTLNSFWHSCHNPADPQVHSADVCAFVDPLQPSWGQTTVKMRCLRAGICNISVGATVQDWDMKSCPQAQEKLEELTIKPDPPVCCMSVEAKCEACKHGVNVEKFCEDEKNQELCGQSNEVSLGEGTNKDADKGNEQPICCAAMEAGCYACKKGISVDVFCAAPENHELCQKAKPVPVEGAPIDGTPSVDVGPTQDVGADDGPQVCCGAVLPKCEACKQGTTVEVFCAEPANKKLCEQTLAPPEAQKSCVARDLHWRWEDRQWEDERCAADCNGSVCHPKCARRCSSSCACNNGCTTLEEDGWPEGRCLSKCQRSDSTRCHSKCAQRCSDTCSCNGRRLSAAALV